ncbi:hypothetical protein ACN28C_31230 [Plantactinospora sp. WMMC1484]|uniref:hypothetical protein n=1 Tax=Plantactinospora sp. WMMC1484 TaxID=3404122 RepID=UPI003BF508DB
MDEPATPPMRTGDEIIARQRDIAAVQGEAYRLAVEAMAVENGIREARAGGYLIGFSTRAAEGTYAARDGRLVWTEPPPDANTHLTVVVADAGDGRFVPQLDVTVTVLSGGDGLFTTNLPFLWHPFLHQYGTNARVPGEGPFDVAVRVGVPRFVRQDPLDSRHFAEPAEVSFPEVRFRTGTRLRR